MDMYFVYYYRHMAQLKAYRAVIKILLGSQGKQVKHRTNLHIAVMFPWFSDWQQLTEFTVVTSYKSQLLTF